LPLQSRSGIRDVLPWHLLLLCLGARKAGDGVAIKQIPPLGNLRHGDDRNNRQSPSRVHSRSARQ
jgi:hypothetical protein